MHLHRRAENLKLTEANGRLAAQVVVAVVEEAIIERELSIGFQGRAWTYRRGRSMVCWGRRWGWRLLHVLVAIN